MLVEFEFRYFDNIVSLSSKPALRARGSNHLVAYAVSCNFGDSCIWAKARTKQMKPTQALLLGIFVTQLRMALCETEPAPPLSVPEPGPFTWFIRSRADFLSAFRGRCISIGGDSVSREMYWSLMMWAYGCHPNGTTPLLLAPEPPEAGGADSAPSADEPAAADGGSPPLYFNDAIDDASDMSIAEYHARFVSRGQSRSEMCHFIADNLKNRAKREIAIPVDARPANDVTVKWSWAPYVRDLARSTRVHDELDSGGCDLFILNAGFWNLRRAQTVEQRVHPEKHVAELISLLTQHGAARAAAAKTSVIWRSCTLIEAEPEPERWFTNRHIAAYNVKIDRLFRAAGLPVINPVHFFRGIKENVTGGQWRFTRDWIHPIYPIQVRMLREVLTNALAIKLRAQAAAQAITGSSSQLPEEGASAAAADSGDGSEGAGESISPLTWHIPRPTVYPKLSPSALLQAQTAWAGEVENELKRAAAAAAEWEALVEMHRHHPSHTPLPDGVASSGNDKPANIEGEDADYDAHEGFDASGSTAVDGSSGNGNGITQGAGPSDGSGGMRSYSGDSAWRPKSRYEILNATSMMLGALSIAVPLALLYCWSKLAAAVARRMRRVRSRDRTQQHQQAASSSDGAASSVGAAVDDDDDSSVSSGDHGHSPAPSLSLAILRQAQREDVAEAAVEVAREVGSFALAAGAVVARVAYSVTAVVAGAAARGLFSAIAYVADLQHQQPPPTSEAGDSSVNTSTSAASSATAPSTPQPSKRSLPRWLPNVLGGSLGYNRLQENQHQSPLPVTSNTSSSGAAGGDGSSTGSRFALSSALPRGGNSIGGSSSSSSWGAGTAYDSVNVHVVSSADGRQMGVGEDEFGFDDKSEYDDDGYHHHGLVKTGQQQHQLVHHETVDFRPSAASSVSLGALSPASAAVSSVTSGGVASPAGIIGSGHRDAITPPPPPPHYSSTASSPESTRSESSGSRGTSSLLDSPPSAPAVVVVDARRPTGPRRQQAHAKAKGYPA